ncbi:hypothetical protein DFH08DRAFT_964580 [Mycena albidolilacea]|uniref:Uncharacterized protein n=1 Tax=Mycena albidolilacea TaxID=1033008 RepID=A0AAD7EN55_9AGAR|nr:hypothetical protein DFH08DRAFT_964580 [Mycena albidolilacea]
MSPDNSQDYLIQALAPEDDKRRRHAEAQRRYRARNLDETRAKAREHMKTLRAKPRTHAEIQEAADKRRESDADYHELLRRRKFKAEFGVDALFKYYLPQYDLREQKHLPGLRFMWDEANKVAKNKKQNNPTKQARESRKTEREKLE